MPNETKTVNELVKGGGITFVAVILAHVLSFLYQFFAARYLSVEEFGLLSLGILVMSFGLIIGKLGLGQGIKKYIPHYESKKEPGAVKGVIVTSYVLALAASVLLAIAVSYFAKTISVSFFHAAELEPILKLFAWAIPLSTCVVLSKAIVIAFRKPVINLIIEVATDRLSRLVLLLIVIFMGGSLFDVSLVYIIGLIIAAFLSAYFVVSIVRRMKKSSLEWKAKELLVFSLPLLFASAIASTVRRFDVVVIGYFMDPSAVAIYGIAFSLSLLMTLISYSLNELYFPIASAHYQKKEQANIESLYDTARRLSFMTSLPIFAAIVLFASQILGIIYGNEYSLGAAPFLILSASVLCLTAFGPLHSTLMVFKKTNELLISSFLLVVLNVTLNILLVPKYGLIGAAGATFVSMVIVQGRLFFIVRKLIDVKLQVKAYVKYIISAVISTLIVAGIASFVEVTTLVMLGLMCLLIAGLYGALLLLTRAFNAEDKQLLRALEVKLGIKNSLVERMIR